MYQALGPAVVVSAGTPIELTVVLGAPDQVKPFVMHAVLLQALPTNTGRIYIGSPGLDKGTLAACGTILAPYSVLPFHTFSAALTIAPNGLTMGSFVIDADNSEEGVLVSLLRT